MADQNTKDTYRGVAFLLLLAVAGYFWWTNSAHEKALAAATDPNEIARLILGPESDPVVRSKDGALEVVFNLPDNLSGWSTRLYFDQYAADLFHRLFAQSSGFDRVAVVGWGEVVTIKGQAIKLKMSSAEMSRTTNAALVWERIDSVNLEKLADRYFAHPSLNR